MVLCMAKITIIHTRNALVFWGNYSSGSLYHSSFQGIKYFRIWCWSKYERYWPLDWAFKWNQVTRGTFPLLITLSLHWNSSHFAVTLKRPYYLLILVRFLGSFCGETPILEPSTSWPNLISAKLMIGKSRLYWTQYSWMLALTVWSLATSVL